MKVLRSLCAVTALALCLAGCQTGNTPSQGSAAASTPGTTKSETGTASSTAAAGATGAAATADTAGKSATVDLNELTIRSNLDKTGKFVINYPEAVWKKHGKALELKAYPKKIIDLSTSSLFLMSKLKVDLIGVSRTVKNTRAAEYYKNVKTIDSGMRSVDTEAVIAMEPDLVIMSGGMKEKFGSQIEKLNIPVYYTSEGPIVNLAVNQAETECLAEAFGGSQAKEDVTAIYAAMRKSAEAYAKEHAAKSAMVIFGPGGKGVMVATSTSFFGQQLKLLGFENAADPINAKGSGVLPSSLEVLAKQNPAVIFLIAPPTGYDPQTLLDAFNDAKAKDPKIYESIQAVKDNKVIALPGNYTTSKGLEVVPDFVKLIDLLSEKLGK